MRIPFAFAVRDHNARSRSGIAVARGNMSCMKEAEAEIRAAAKKRARSKEAFDRDDAALRDLLVKWRGEGEGPSDMARWSGFTREWVAKVAPAPKRAADA